MAQKRTSRAARPHLGGEVRRTVLPSGARVLTERVAASHTFALGCFAGVGSRHESAGLHGAAHFLEHVLFKGTATRSAVDISSAFDAVGGEANAYTAKEHTCFYAKVLADDAAMAVDVMTDMLTRSLIRTADVDAERDVILDEIAMHADDPMETAYSVVAEELFGGHALARDVIGTRASITAITRDQVHGFWKRHYRPSDLVVAAAGDVDHDWLVERVAALPGEPQARRPQRAPLGRHEATVCQRTRPLEQVNALLGFRGLELFDERRYAADLLALVLGGGMSSRLFVEVRERRGLAYHIDAATSSYTDAGQFGVEWMSGPDRTAEILRLVRDILGDVTANGVTEAELARAKGQMRGQTLLAYETPDARMMRLGRRELVGDERTVDEILDAFELVTPAQVRDVARDLLVAPPVLACVGARTDRRPLERAIGGWAKSVG